MRNPDKTIIRNLNINLFPKKFEQVKDIVMQYIGILVLTEIKLDDTFTTAQVLGNGFSEPCIFDRNSNGGGVMIYIREDISGKLLDKYIFP